MMSSASLAVPLMIETPKRRFEDKSVAQWKRIAALVIAFGAGVVIGMMVRHYSGEEIRQLVAGLIGGAIAVVTVGIPLAWGSNKSLENVAKARAEEIKDLQEKYTRLETEKAADKLAQALRDKERDDRHEKERAEWISKISQLEHMVEDLLTENGLLRNALGRRNDAPNKRILFVDDNPDTCTLYRFLLMGEGYEVTTALSAVEGLKAYEEHRRQGLPYAAAILDFSMPFLSGEEAVDIIQTFGDTQIKIAIYTGHSPRDLQAFIEKHPNVPVWKKTMDNHVFLQHVKELIGQ
jgi:CheY-like chemotaxis protein